ncbi:hypothetical protein D9M68_842890 [compost metagenome]
MHTDLHTATLELGRTVGMLVPQPDGVRLSTSTDNLAWFARQLARLPFDFEIIHPAELRMAIREQAQRMLRLAQVKER